MPSIQSMPTILFGATSSSDQTLPTILILGLLVIIVIGLMIFFYVVPIRLWIAARTSGVDISLFELIAMRLRRIPPTEIVNPLMTTTQAGVIVSRANFEALYLAGGNVNLVAQALISAEKAQIPLDYDRAAAIDLAGRNVFDAVKM